MIQRAFKLILNDIFGLNSSPKVFLDDQSRHKFYTMSRSIFSDFKTLLRETYQQFGSETKPVIGLNYLLPVGKIWWRSEVTQFFLRLFQS